MRIAICDDEPIAISVIGEILSENLMKLNQEIVIIPFADSEELFCALCSGEGYDVVVLDIDMPKMDGIRLGIQAAEQLKDTVLIYVSNREDKVWESFKARPFRFLRKCNLRKECPEAAKAIVEEIQKKRGEKLIFEVGNQMLCLPSTEIIYVESFRKKQLMHTTEREIELTSSFYKILNQLEGKGFIQIHKSYAVNYQFIRNIHNMEIELDNHVCLPIGRSRIKKVRQEFQYLVMGCDILDHC